MFRDRRSFSFAREHKKLLFLRGRGKIKPDLLQGNATQNANLITIGAYGVPATVQPLPPMHYQRAFHNSVVMPDGKVLIIGGQVQVLLRVWVSSGFQTRARSGQARATRVCCQTGRF